MLIASSIIAAASVFLTSCGGGVSTDPTLKTDIDSLSYAFGANLYGPQGGLEMYIQQMGVVKDTAQFKGEYMARMNGETDEAKKAEMQKALQGKLDSLDSANKRNLAEFLRGVSESVKSSKSQNAYYMGITIGNQMSEQMFARYAMQMYGTTNVDSVVNKDVFLSGLATAVAGKAFKIDDPVKFLQARTEANNQRMQAEQAKQMEEQYAENKAAGEKFLEENKTKEGVVVLPSGLQYKILKAGKGAKPQKTDIVNVTYKGMLIDRSEFETNTTSFPVNQVIPGWTEALQLMPAGSKWELYIPAELAYGAHDTGKIKPYSTLIFEVELHEINPKQK